MRKIVKFNSVTFKSIVIVILFSVIFMLIATPLLINISYNTLKPLLVNHLTMKTGESAALMSNALGRSNPVMYVRAFNEEFITLFKEYSNDKSNKSELIQLITEQTAPFETTVELSNAEDFTFTSYPAVYIEGEGFFCDDYIKKAAEELLSAAWFRDYKESRNTEALYPPIIDCDEYGKNSRYFSYIFTNQVDFSFLNDMEADETYYVMLITDFSDIMAFWQYFIDIDVEDYAFIGKDSDVLFQNLENTDIDTDLIEEKLISDRQHHVVSYVDGDDAYYSVLISYESEGLRCVIHVTKENFLDLYSEIFTIVQIMFLLFIAVFILIFIFILGRIFKRLTAVNEKMAVVRNGDYSVKIIDNSEDEIGQLATTFNTMAEKIQDDINNLLIKENREKMLQYNLMVSAVDPHFIYNTLNTVTRLVELGRTNEVLEVVDALINFMKDNLKMKGYNAYDTVQNEKTILQQYVLIQNYLCDNTIQLNFDVDEKDLKLKIPKFLLQPIVENSIIHGILLNIDSDGNLVEGKINISMIKKENVLEIIVDDNGIGMTQEAIEKYYYSDEKIVLEEDTYSEHIGILNIKTRLTYLYEDNYILDVQSEPNQGTTVIIQIPL